MTEKFCFFDSNHKRVKSFVTLTTSTYDPLLLAILECKHAVRGNIEVFGRCSIQHLKKSVVLGIVFYQLDFSWKWQQSISKVLLKPMEKILEKVKRCEFHFRDSINKKASTLGEHGSKFKEISLSVLTSTTQEVCINALKNMQDFVNKDKKLADLQHWFNWLG